MNFLVSKCVKVCSNLSKKSNFNNRNWLVSYSNNL